MRLCSMCPDGTADNARCHLDKECKHATPAKLAEREKAVQERRQKRKAEQEKAKAEKAEKKTRPLGRLSTADALVRVQQECAPLSASGTSA